MSDEILKAMRLDSCREANYLIVKLKDLLSERNEGGSDMTISTHNGSQVCRQHCLRNPKVARKESHINPEGVHETWRDIPPRKAYEKIFGEAQREYNAKKIASGHSELVIDDYYKHVQKDKKKNIAYSMIVQIGNYSEHPDVKLSRKILRKFCATWKDRNPNLKMIGCYWHADEAIGAETPTGHIHITYIPVAYGLTRGMSVQNSMNQALAQQGFVTASKRQLAVVAWEKRENAYLEQLCREQGLEIEHPDVEKQKHLDIKQYRQKKQIEELERRSKELEDKNNELVDRIDNLIDRHNEIIDDIEELEEATIDRAEEILETYKNIDRTR